MKKYLILFLFLSLPANAQSAAEQVTPGFLTISGCPSGSTSCFLPYTSSNPLPISVFGGTLGNVLTSNGTGNAATFQPSGGGSITPGPCLTTAGGQVNTTQPVNPQTGTSYTLLATDGCSLVTFTNAASVAVTLPAATTTGFTDGFSFVAQNAGAGVATLTASTGSTFNGAACPSGSCTTLVLSQNQSCQITSKSGNWAETSCTPNYFLANVGLGTTAPAQAIDVSGSSTTQVLLENKTAATSTVAQDSPLLEFSGNTWNSGSGSNQMRASMDVEPFTFNASPNINELAFYVGAQFGATPTKQAFITSDGRMGTFGGLTLDAPSQSVASTFLMKNETAATSSVPQPSNIIQLQGWFWSTSSGNTQNSANIQLVNTVNNAATGIQRIAFSPQAGSTGGAFNEVLSVSSNQRVGIGTTNPITTLDVAGGINAAAGMSHARRTIADAAATITSTDYEIAYTSISAARIVSVACTVGTTAAAQYFIVKDESGSSSITNTITITPTSGTIDGAASKAINSTFGVLRFYSNGTNCFSW